MRYILPFLFCFSFQPAFSQDSTFIKVHCFYGSRPLRQYKQEEPKWFGGVWGGHVSISWDSSRVLSFVHNGEFHWFERKNDPHSRYLGRELRRYRGVSEGGQNQIKQATVFIPATLRQKQKLDSIADAYLRETPYDYAFFGMRCASATYEILAQVGLVKEFGYKKTWRKMFYPRKLRKYLFKQAKKENWRIERQAGSHKRKWDWDYLFR